MLSSLVSTWIWSYPGAQQGVVSDKQTSTCCIHLVLTRMDCSRPLRGQKLLPGVEIMKVDIEQCGRDSTLNHQVLFCLLLRCVWSLFVLKHGGSVHSICWRSPASCWRSLDQHYCCMITMMPLQNTAGPTIIWSVFLWMLWSEPFAGFQHGGFPVLTYSRHRLCQTSMLDWPCCIWQKGLRIMSIKHCSSSSTPHLHMVASQSCWHQTPESPEHQMTYLHTYSNWTMMGFQILQETWMMRFKLST